MQLDAWIRWTYRCNGWMWSVFRGAELIAEGCEPSEQLARLAASHVTA